MFIPSPQLKDYNGSVDTKPRKSVPEDLFVKILIPVLEISCSISLSTQPNTRCNVTESGAK